MNDPKLIQIILQGSCLPTVNGGPMELCRAFLPMLPVVYDDESTSTGDIDDVEDDDDEFLDEDEDEVTEGGEAKKGGKGFSVTPPPVSDNLSQTDASERSAGAPDSDNEGLTEEEKKKAAALAEEMKPTPEQLQKLRENVREFLKACGMALKVNKFMSSDQDLFHRELSNGYEKLCDELYPLVGAIPGAAGVMGSQRALQTARPRGAQLPASPSRGEIPVVNGNLIPSLKREGRHSRRWKGGSIGGTSALGSNTGGSSTGSARAKMSKGETFGTISLSLARKRADESLDGDPNSLSSVGVSTPASSRSKKGTNTRLNVLSPMNASSASGQAGSGPSATPLKVRVPVDDDDTSSSVDSDHENPDVADLSDEDGSHEASSTKKSHHHKGHSRHHK